MDGAIESVIVKEMLAHGIVGVVALVAGYIAYKKDQEASKIRDARIADKDAESKRYYDLTRDLDMTLSAALDALELKEARRRHRDENGEE